MVTEHAHKELQCKALAAWGENCMTYDRARNFRLELCVASFINSLIRTWCSSGADKSNTKKVRTILARTVEFINSKFYDVARLWSTLESQRRYERGRVGLYE